MRGDGRMAKNPKKTLLRLLGYMRKYLPILVVVLVCIFLTSFAQTMASRSLGTLVDDYILPMVSSGSTDYSPMARFLLKIAGVDMSSPEPVNSALALFGELVDEMEQLV